MGRIFEKRKATMFKRYAKMAKAFTRLGKEIAMAVKAGGPNPDTNPRLRAVMQNAKAVNMPKVNIDGAIKRASDKDSANYEEVIYEGKAPHGIPLLIECSTDNPTRTVASVRMHLNRSEGQLGTSGSVSFLFERKIMFRVDATGLDKDNTELDLIDYGAEELNWDEENNELIVQTAFTDFGKMQAGLEEKKYTLKESSKVFIPTTTQEITPEKEADVMALIEKLEDDDDVVAVYHNIA